MNHSRPSFEHGFKPIVDFRYRTNFHPFVIDDILVEFRDENLISLGQVASSFLIVTVSKSIEH
nr:hypothetical protein [Candidatus Sigynarchaeota archaeon]